MSKRMRALTACLAVLAVTGLFVAPAVGAAADHDGEEAFVVDLDAEGDATVTLHLTYDLSDDDERAAFEDLRGDEEAQTDIRERFESRLADVADDAAAETGREMSISDGSVDLSTTDDDVGVVELSARWHGLAAVDGDSVTATEPFASGFVPDQRFVLVGPDGYAVESATPEPAEADDGALVWSAGTELEGFEVTFADDDKTADGETADETGDGAPGFGVAVALVAVLAAALLAVRRQ